MIDFSALRYPEAVLTLPDETLVELCAVRVMGLTCKTDAQRIVYWETGEGLRRYHFRPLSDYNHTLGVIEAKRREWEEDGSRKYWMIWNCEGDDGNPIWNAAIRWDYAPKGQGVATHPSLARVICAAAVWDSLQKEVTLSNIS